jgi:hypothetical protein
MKGRLILVFVVVLGCIAWGCKKADTFVSPSSPHQIQYIASSNTSAGPTSFIVDGKEFTASHRGFNFLVIDLGTGTPRDEVKSFDTWGDTAGITTNSVWVSLASFLNDLPNGALVLAAVHDEAGLTSGFNGGCFYGYPPGSHQCCVQLIRTDIENGRRALEALGAKQLRNFCYYDSWSMIAVKGEGAKAENHTPYPNGNAVASYILTLK